MTMKKNLSFIFASLVLVLVGCVKNEPVEVLPVDEITVIKAYYSEESKAALNGLAVEWQVGDKIKVNNINSAALEAKDITLPSAEFTFEGLLEAPFYGVYNATAAYDFKTTGANPNCRINLDTPQNYVEGSFDPHVATCWGIGESEPKIPFNHSMAYIKITPTEGSAPEAKIAYIKLSSRSGEETLAGRFYLYFKEDGHMEPVPAHANNRTFVVMQGPAEGVALGKPFIIAVPVQEYTAGLAVKIVSTDGQYMERNLKAITPEVGTIYPIETPYNPTGIIPATATAAEVTSSTACFTWTLVGNVATDVAHAWTVQCSASSDFTDATEYTIPEGSASDVWNNETPKFCFGGLAQGTTYYFRVKSGSGDWSEAVSAITSTYNKDVVSADVEVGSVILAEDFSALAVQAEIPANAAGVNESGTAFVKRTNSYTIANASTSNLPESLKEWGFARGTAGSANANLYANQGHIKLGTGNAQSYLVTPELNAIPEDQMATLEVTLTLAVYPDAKNDLKNVTKFIVSSETGTMKAGTNFFTCKSAFSNKVEGELASTADARAKWATYTVTLPNVRHSERLMIAAANDAGNNRLLVSDVKAKIVSLGTQKVRDIKLVQADRTFATFKWENIASSIGNASTYCLNVYKDEACTQPVYNQDVITYEAPFSRYSPFGTSKYIGQKSGSGIAPTELQVSCGLLEPNTDYWFRVKPIEGTITVEGKKTKTNDDKSSTFSNTAAGAGWSDPFHFKTAPEHVAVTNEVIYTGFDALSIGPNMETMNAGVAPQFDLEATSSPQKEARIKFLADFAAGTYNYGWCTWAPDRCNVPESNTKPCPFGSVVAWWGFCTENADAVYLDGTNKNFTLNGSTKRYNRLGNVGDVAGWYMTSQTFPGMGHALMNDVGNFVGTPALTQNLGASAATCTVRVKAAKIANDGNANDVTIKVYKYSKATNTLSTTEVATITIPGKSCYKSWTDATNYTTDFTTKDYTVEVDLAKGDALVFAVSKYAIFDEIQIVKK